MRAALYARVSTRDKDQEPENQIIILRRWASQHGHEVAGEWVDQARSTAWADRTGWQALLAAVETGGVDVVAVVRLDRAFRSSRDAHNGIAGLAEHGAAFVATEQPMLDMTQPVGRLLLAVLAAVAEFELTLVRERTMDGLARAKGQGKRLGRPPGSADRAPRRKVGYLLREERLRKARSAEQGKARRKEYQEWRRTQ